MIRTVVTLLAPALFVVMAATHAHSGLIMTGIYDGEASTPKGIELYVETTGSYSGWAVELEFNANTSFTGAYTFDSTVYNAGDFIYLTSTASDGTLPSTGIIISDSSFNMNGDDRVRLTDGTNVIDQFGVDATDGTGQSWEYTDSYAIRVSGTTADGGFTESHWTIAPINTLDNGNGPLASALGSYAVPEPGTIALLPGCLGILFFRRRNRGY